MNNILETAKKYLARKISVIPVARDKKPLVEWKEYQNRIATNDELDKWFKDYPDMQIGIVTGKISNLIVVDIDDANMDLSWLPETAIVKTGSGGYHYYYAYTSAFSNKARIKKNVDIRGDGGYVIAPPSFNLKGQYTVIKKMNCQPFPLHLFDEQKKVNYTQIKTEYTGFGQGQRNDEMTRYIGHLLAKIHPSEWDNIAWQIAQEANTKNTPPLTEYELKTIFQSIVGKERNNPTDRWYKKSEKNITELWEGEDDEVVLMSEVAAKQKENNFESYSCGIDIFNEVMIGGFRDGDLVIISAPTGLGKTTLCQNFTYHLAKQGMVSLWFSFEVSVNNLWQKFKNMGMTDDDVCYTPAKIVTGQMEWIEKKIKEAKEKYYIKSVFIDHMGFLMPKIKSGLNINKIESNYSMYLTQISRELKTLAVNNNIIIFCPAHMKKTDNPDLNDIGYSAGIPQEADYVFIMNREKNPNDEDMNFYTSHTEIILRKNRLTGLNVRGWFDFQDNKFIYDKFYKPVKKNKSKF